METIAKLVQESPVLFFSLIAWSVVWKSIALWLAARNGQLVWYIALVLVNTVAILEIIYLLFFRKKKQNPGHFATR